MYGFGETTTQDLPRIPKQTLWSIWVANALKLTRQISDRGACDEGAAIVEIALSLPITLIVLTGIFSFSIALNQKLVLSEAVATGGRYLAVDRGDTDPCATTASKIYAAAPTLTQSKVSLTFNLNGTAYSSPSCSGTTSMVSGGTAQVSATYPCSFAVYGLSLGTCSLKASVTEVVQ